jgi:hypothetical protein
MSTVWVRAKQRFRFAKLAAGVLCLILITIWLGNRYRNLRYYMDGPPNKATIIQIRSGIIEYFHSPREGVGTRLPPPPLPDPPFLLLPPFYDSPWSEAFTLWLWKSDLYSQQLHSYRGYPIFPFMLSFAILWAMFYWLERRVRFGRGHCQSCGYNLTDNVSGVCPECGVKSTAGILNNSRQSPPPPLPHGRGSD